MERKITLTLSESDWKIIANRLTVRTAFFNGGVYDEKNTKVPNPKNYETEYENEDSEFSEKVSNLHSLVVMNISDEKTVLNALESLNWLTNEVIQEVKRIWALPHPVEPHEPSPRLKAIKLIKELGEKNGFKIGLSKAVEIKDKILSM